MFECKLDSGTKEDRQILTYAEGVLYTCDDVPTEVPM